MTERWAEAVVAGTLLLTACSAASSGFGSPGDAAHDQGGRRDEAGRHDGGRDAGGRVGQADAAADARAHLRPDAHRAADGGALPDVRHPADGRQALDAKPRVDAPEDVKSSHVDAGRDAAESRDARHAPDARRDARVEDGSARRDAHHDGGGAADAADAGDSGNPADATLDAAVDAANDALVLTAPTDFRDRIGVYAWGFDTTAWPGTPDRLNWGASKVSGLGARTIRVYLGPQDIYQVLPPADAGSFDLRAAAASHAYSTLFSDPSFDTYLLTTYSAGDDLDDWSDGYTAEEAATEQEQISALGAYLLQTFPAKTFILLQWEGDNAISPYASSDVAYEGFTAWIEARAAGVVAARAAAGATTARLYSGVEYNLVRNLATAAPCDTSANKCVVSAVIPNVSVDYYSYSSWQSLVPFQTPSEVAATLQADLTTALGWAAMGDPSVTPARFIVGEFGAPREEADLGECAAMLRTAAVIPAVASWGASYGVFWQIIDNVPSGTASDLVVGFGLYKAPGPPSLSAQLFSTLYSTQTATPPPTPSCPSINQGGVVNGVTFTADDIDGGTTIAIFGADFTDAGDVVHVREATEDWDIDGGEYFYESEGQINATLPGVGAGQSALVYVTNGLGVDSNGQVISILP
jgi:hypothetical protein